MKKILAKTPNGDHYIDLRFVAENRADYYATIDNVERGSEEWQSEVDYVMEDDYEGIDWLLNNMDWEDVEHVSEKLNDTVGVTDDDFWCDSDHFEIL